ncbi:hypothetical protein [Lysinibacillus xylanilyticus]|uniref:hypothetical protein n=1 Tax=Lysinibacillus xylanilyticus TaxID=582475 RepID=UPI003D035D1C
MTPRGSALQMMPCSEASATNVFCAKAKRQQQMFSVRKRSVSNKCFLCESEASATTRPVAIEIKAKLK